MVFRHATECLILARPEPRSRSMRGHPDAQPGIFHYFQPEDLIPAEHPLRRVKAWADEALLAHDVAHQFFDAVVRQARGAGLLSDEHFSVDGTLIEAWASLKSFRPTTPRDREPPP